MFLSQKELRSHRVRGAHAARESVMRGTTLKEQLNRRRGRASKDSLKIQSNRKSKSVVPKDSLMLGAVEVVVAARFAQLTDSHIGASVNT